MMFTDEKTGLKRPLTTNERVGAFVLIMVVLIGCLSVFFMLITGEFDAKPEVSPTPTRQPVTQRVIRQVGTEAIPVDTPIEFYIERGEIRWREFIPELTP